jgi:hypothetical protein
MDRDHLVDGRDTAMSALPGKPLRVAMNEAQFRHLVAGDIISFAVASRRIEIILSDIGSTAMLRAVLDGMQLAPPPDPPQAREFLPRKPKG